MSRSVGITRRHGRACPGHPRLGCFTEDVDARDKPAHDVDTNERNQHYGRQLILCTGAPERLVHGLSTDSEPLLLVEADGAMIVLVDVQIEALGR